MNGIHRDFNLSCKGVKFRLSGFTGKFILLALKQTGNFPSLMFEWQVELTHSVLSTVPLPDIHTSIRFLCTWCTEFISITLCNWSVTTTDHRTVQIYSGQLNTRAATIHRCTGEPQYFLSRYEYRYLNGISLYHKTTKYFSSKIKNYFTNIQ